MKVAIVGSRDFDDPEADSDNKHTYDMRFDIADLVGMIRRDEYLVSGGARGADYHAESAARRYGVSRIIHEADWRSYGKKAGPMRNVLVINDADVLFVFFTDREEAYSRQERDGKMSGSVHAVGLAGKKGIPVYEYDARQKKWYATANGKSGVYGKHLDTPEVLFWVRQSLFERAIQSDAQRDEGVRVVHKTRSLGFSTLQPRPK